MKVRRLLLFVLVAVNLTIVCQGHPAESEHTGVHLALLGEPHLEVEEDGRFDREPRLPHEPGHVAAEDTPVVNSNLLPIEAGRNSDPALLGASHSSSLDALAVAFLGVLAGATHTFSVRLATPLTWTSLLKKPPEPPPPQTRT